MTGGGRAPAVANERAEKQDLGLDASSHFAGEGVLHSLSSPVRSREEEVGVGEVGFCPATLLSPLGNHTPSFFFAYFLHFLNSFLSPENVCSLAEQCGSWRGTGAHRPPKKPKRASGCRVQGRLKGWNEKGVIRGPLFLFSSQNQKKATFKYRKLHRAALLRLHEFRRATTKGKLECSR